MSQQPEMLMNTRVLLVHGPREGYHAVLPSIAEIEEALCWNEHEHKVLQGLLALARKEHEFMANWQAGVQDRAMSNGKPAT